MSVKLTESAARQIKKQLEKRGKGIGLKLGIKNYCNSETFEIARIDFSLKSNSIYAM